MRKITDITDNLPPMLSGKELISALSVLPEYDPEIVNESAAERLMALSDISCFNTITAEKIYKFNVRSERIGILNVIARI